MNSSSYFPNYYSIEDISVTQEKVSCRTKMTLMQLGFLDPGSETGDLADNKEVNLPLWYLKEMKINNPYYKIEIPSMYKNVHKAVCEAETTHIEMGKLHHYFYEYGRYLTAFDPHHIIGQIIFETMRQRVRLLLDISKVNVEEGKPEYRLASMEMKLYEAGVRTNNSFMDWMRLKSTNIMASELVQERNKKRKRALLDDDDNFASAKRISV